jgi:RNA polymerase sigma-70 factor (ECF subfamily)
MPLSEKEILRFLMQSRERISAAAWLVVKDAHVAEDIFQNTVLKAVTKDVSFEAEAALFSWAFITARRDSLNWFRKHRRESVGIDEDILTLIHQDWQNDHLNPKGNRFELLRDCMEELPQKSEKILRLRYFEGLSCGEIADSISITLDAVYKRISRIQNSLRKCVELKMQPGGNQ